MLELAGKREMKGVKTCLWNRLGSEDKASTRRYQWTLFFIAFTLPEVLGWLPHLCLRCALENPRKALFMLILRVFVKKQRPAPFSSHIGYIPPPGTSGDNRWSRGCVGWPLPCFRIFSVQTWKVPGFIYFFKEGWASLVSLWINAFLKNLHVGCFTTRFQNRSA